jgi:hypothetical protein
MRSIIERVSEHRTLFGSLAVTLIGIGLAGYVSLQISGAVAGHPVKLGPTDHLCLWVLFIGVALFALVCISLAHQWHIKRQLAHFTTDGALLAQDANKVALDDQEAFDELHARFATWVREVFKWLKKHDSAAAIHFGNDTGRLVTEGLSGSGGVGGLRANLDTRMARLGEITEKRL